MQPHRKPPLARSPVRSSLDVRPAAAHSQTPPGSLTKSQSPNPRRFVGQLELRPEYRSISCQLRALAKKVSDEFGNGDQGKAAISSGGDGAAAPIPLFQRGRRYDEYSARRNERLRKRMRGEDAGGDEGKSAHRLGVNVESGKRRDSKMRKSMPAALFSAERRGQNPNPRYSLRSSTVGLKKPPLAMAFQDSSAAAAGGGGRKTRASSGRKV